jgi:predicted HAD superfamily Cof-like phosphohydrolase
MVNVKFMLQLAVESVADFHKAMGLFIGENGSKVTYKTLELRKALHVEECKETISALLNDDKIETLDGFCDLLYVLAGTIISLPITSKSGYDRSYEEYYNPHYRLEDASILNMIHNTAGSVDLANWQIDQMMNKNSKNKNSETLDDIKDLHVERCVDYIYDSMYTIVSNANLLKLPLMQAFLAVHESNMAKRLKDGRVFHDKKGKLRKLPNFEPPDLKHVLDTGTRKPRATYTELPEDTTVEQILEKFDWVIKQP